MGPLEGIKIVEMAAIGPVPFCGMMLAEMGADIIRVGRKDAARRAPERGDVRHEFYNRSRPSIAMDLKKPEAIETVLKLMDKADAVLEGFRPGVMERLGLGPEVTLARNPRLVYGRMTGWGQYGPLAQAAGHDINYLALTGTLHAIGPKGKKPAVPLNLIGDFGGGAMYLAVGVLAALLDAKRTGKGQVIDAAMTDGASHLNHMTWGMFASGYWKDERESNGLDGGAHYYDTYETKDGKYIALGAIEPQFYALLREKAGLSDKAFDAQQDREQWPVLKAKMTEIFKTKTRDEWCALMEGTDACFAPILSLGEAPKHPHNVARKSFVTLDGITQPAPAPRFSRTPAEIRSQPRPTGADTESALAAWGIGGAAQEALKKVGAI